jgi:murein DD-endopeptidase MepM/ murein hydrolase activator NlpD
MASLLGLVVVTVLLPALTGCSTAPLTEPVEPARIASAPAAPMLVGSHHTVRRGETLWRLARSYGVTVEALASANQLSQASPLGVGQRLFIPLPRESKRFLWPVRGSIRASAASKGVEIAAPPGSLVRASRSGQVALATRRLAGWGATVVLDHFDGYLTIYSGLDQVLVTPGAGLPQGTPVGSLGTQALHFEIRQGTRARSPLALLPAE